MSVAKGKINKVCRPKVVTSAHISVRPIVTVGLSMNGPL